MKNLIIFFLVLTVLLIQVVPILAQEELSGPKRLDDLKDWKRSGQASMPFLKFGAGARLMAMGDAGIANANDATALFYNPAGIALIDNRSIMLSNMDWLLDTKIQSGAFAINLGNIGTFGLSALFFNYGDPIKATEITAFNESGYNDIGELEPSEFLVGLAYARRISSQFAIGGQVKIAHQDLLGGNIKTRIAYKTPEGWIQEEHDANMTIFAFDVGTIYNTGFRDLTLAMSFRNFGQEVEYEQDAYDIPLTFSFGVTASAFQLVDQQQKDMDLRVNIDYFHLRDWSERMNFGLEYSFMKMFYLRGGYKYNYSSEGLCVGAGVNLKLPMGKVRIDYAYKDTKDTLFDAVHVYSLAVDF